MSTLKAEVVTIDRVERHPAADRLDLVSVRGWNCVAGRDEPTTPKYKAGDKVLYLPVDSVLPADLEAHLFPPDSKVTLHKSRIRTIKLRGAVSQGMVVDLPSLESIRPGISRSGIGQDLTEKLGITKYEPPAANVPNHMRQGNASHLSNPNFQKYTDIENFKNYNNLFSEGEHVYVSEKLHGTSARYACLPTVANTWWKKVLKFVGFLPKFEFCFGSRNVQLQAKKGKVFYDKNVYAIIADQLNLRDCLKPGEALYGEIVGDGIQGGYTYGCKPGEYRFFAYDVKVDGQWLNPTDFMTWCDDRNIDRVPELFTGGYDEKLVKRLATGDSLVGRQKIREGVVIKPLKDIHTYMGRKVLKLINDDYLLQKDTTDWH